jgi:hypothetical protein
MPPAAETRNREVLVAERITPSRFHVPPNQALQSLQMVTGGPPERATLRRPWFPQKENAICCPSGDQNGVLTKEPGVGISIAVAVFIERTKSVLCAVKAIRCPSGETAGRSHGVKFSLSGAGIWKRTIAGGAGSVW